MVLYRYSKFYLIVFTVFFIACSRYPEPAGKHLISYFDINDKHRCIQEYRNEHLSDKQIKTRLKIQKFSLRNQKKIDSCPKKNIVFVCYIQYLGYDPEYLKMIEKNPEMNAAKTQPFEHQAFAEAIGEVDSLEFFYESKKYPSKQRAKKNCQAPPEGFYKLFKYTIY